jgi:hypothetical protein
MYDHGFEKVNNQVGTPLKIVLLEHVAASFEALGGYKPKGRGLGSR